MCKKLLVENHGAHCCKKFCEVEILESRACYFSQNTIQFLGWDITTFLKNNIFPIRGILSVHF